MSKIHKFFYIQGLVMTGQGISQTLAATKPTLEVGLITLCLGAVLWGYG